jgi:hypothetical protein
VAIADLKRANEEATLVAGERLVIDIKPKTVVTKRAAPAPKKAQAPSARPTAKAAPTRPSAAAQVVRP